LKRPDRRPSSSPTPAQVRAAAVTCLLALTVTGCFDTGKGSGTRPSAGGSTGSTKTNQPPVISGQAPPSARVSATYLFVPAANDPDGDRLTYKISGKPAWATFDASTGQLFGTPTAGSTGSYQNIRISVTDGRATTSLAPFAIDVVSAASNGTATLKWAAPTQLSTGAPLRDLAGFRVYYSQVSTRLNEVLAVTDPQATSAAVSNLGPGTWFFAITAYTASGAESKRSNTVSKAF
jgi:hypothetical protein